MPLVSGNMARLISIMITPMSLNPDAGFEQAGPRSGRRFTGMFRPSWWNGPRWDLRCRLISGCAGRCVSERKTCWLLIRKKWKEHVSGARDWHYLLWPALMFQAWMAEASSSSKQAQIQAGQRLTIQPT